MHELVYTTEPAPFLHNVFCLAYRNTCNICTLIVQSPLYDIALKEVKLHLNVPLEYHDCL